MIKKKRIKNDYLKKVGCTFQKKKKKKKKERKKVGCRIEKSRGIGLISKL